MLRRPPWWRRWVFGGKDRFLYCFSLERGSNLAVFLWHSLCIVGVTVRLSLPQATFRNTIAWAEKGPGSPRFMNTMKQFLAVVCLTLGLAACGPQGSVPAADVQLDQWGAQYQSDALSGTFWDWIWGTGSSAAAPETYERPSDRPQVICSWWCPTGYSRRSVTVGPTCEWYHVGKCVDRSSYVGESCGFPAKACVPGLACEEATPEETERNAHPEACH